MTMKKITFYIIFTTYMVICENATKNGLCEICKCTQDERKFIIDCVEKKINKFPENWPEEFLPLKNQTDTHIILNLNKNTITKLENIPEINIASTKIDISIANCSLKEIQYGAFKNIKTINHLNLGHNKLTGDALRGDIFRGPFNMEEYEPIELEYLNLEYNLIHSFDHKMFQHTPRLKRLNLNNNPFKTIDSVTTLALFTLTNLEVLDLSYTGIDKLPDGLMKQFKKLNQLFLAGNQFTVVPSSLGALGGSLRFLSINDNPIETLNDESFLGLWRLEHLEIAKMKTLTEVKAGTFIQLKSLTTLKIHDNPNLEYLSHEAFRELKENWKIQELYLQNNNLKSISGDLALWDELKVLNLENNPWDCNCEMAMNFTANHTSLKKLLTQSKAKCLTPIEASGFPLSQLNPERTCSAAPTGQNGRYVSHARPTSILISLSIVILVLFIAVIIGVRITRWRKKARELANSPIRYQNISLD